MMSEPGQLIATGRTAEIYGWGERHVLKLFRPGRPAEDAEYEARIGRIVSAAGLPVPAVSEVLEIDGRVGIIYERVEGPPMGELLTGPAALESYARLLADLHAALHETRAPGLPEQRGRLEKAIMAMDDLPSDLREAVLRALRRLPPGDRLCHGDFHPWNVIMSSHGQVIVDWNDATRGNPLGDVARTWLLFELVSSGSEAPVQGLDASMVQRFLAAYLDHYFALRPADHREFAAWKPVVAAARLHEGIAGERERLLAIVSAGVRRIMADDS